MARQIVEELIGVLGLDVDEQSFREGDRALDKNGGIVYSGCRYCYGCRNCYPSRHYWHGVLVC